MGDDTVVAYFGLRTYELGAGPKGKRPLLNGNFTFAAGFLDQSWWPVNARSEYKRVLEYLSR